MPITRLHIKTSRGLRFLGVRLRQHREADLKVAEWLAPWNIRKWRGSYATTYFLRSGKELQI